MQALALIKQEEKILQERDVHKRRLTSKSDERQIGLLVGGFVLMLLGASWKGLRPNRNKNTKVSADPAES